MDAYLHFFNHFQPTAKVPGTSRLSTSRGGTGVSCFYLFISYLISNITKSNISYVT